MWDFILGILAGIAGTRTFLLIQRIKEQTDYHEEVVQEKVKAHREADIK